MVLSGDSGVMEGLMWLHARSLLGCPSLCFFPPAGPSPSQSLEYPLPKFLHAGSRFGEGCVVAGRGGSLVLLVAGLCGSGVPDPSSVWAGAPSSQDLSVGFVVGFVVFMLILGFNNAYVNIRFQ